MLRFFGGVFLYCGVALLPCLCLASDRLDETNAPRSAAWYSLLALTAAYVGSGLACLCLALCGGEDGAA